MVRSCGYCKKGFRWNVHKKKHMGEWFILVDIVNSDLKIQRRECDSFLWILQERIIFYALFRIIVIIEQ